MKLSNFELVESDSSRLFARVDATTTVFLWWKKTERRLVAQNGVFWTFVDTGEFTPGTQCEFLFNAYRFTKAAEQAGVDLA